VGQKFQMILEGRERERKGERENALPGSAGQIFQLPTGWPLKLSKWFVSIKGLTVKKRWLEAALSDPDVFLVFGVLLDGARP